MAARRDPCGVPYDGASTDSTGATRYWRTGDGEAGGPPGGSQWTSEHDCNPVCGCHLASKCQGCGVCTSCDGCYCEEW